PTVTYTLSLHDALPICFLLVELLDLGEERLELRRFAAALRDGADVALTVNEELRVGRAGEQPVRGDDGGGALRHDRKKHARLGADRKSTRLNSSHDQIS